MKLASFQAHQADRDERGIRYLFENDFEAFSGGGYKAIIKAYEQTPGLGAATHQGFNAFIEEMVRITRFV